MRRCGGFTLVELLVVIAVISILAAMLMPALEGALATARQVQCVSNVRQFMLAMSMYLDDNDGLIPPRTVYSEQGEIMPHLARFRDGGYLPSLGPLVCPTAPAETKFKWVTGDPHDRDANPWKKFYEYSASGAPGSGTNIPNGTFYWQGGVRNRNATDPDKEFALNSLTFRRSNVRDPSAFGPIFDWNSMHRTAPGRSYGFFDGHAAFVPRERYLWCTANWAEHVTPLFRHQALQFYTPQAWCGYGRRPIHFRNQDGYGNFYKRLEKVLRITY